MYKKFDMVHASCITQTNYSILVFEIQAVIIQIYKYPIYTRRELKRKIFVKALVLNIHICHHGNVYFFLVGPVTRWDVTKYNNRILRPKSRTAVTPSPFNLLHCLVCREEVQCLRITHILLPNQSSLQSFRRWSSTLTLQWNASNFLKQHKILGNLIIKQDR